MCGIVGFTGMAKAAPILLEGLERLEYRGYDSAGMAVFSHGKIELIKKKGHVAELAGLLASHDFSDATCGIGHVLCFEQVLAD